MLPPRAWRSGRLGARELATLFWPGSLRLEPIRDVRPPVYIVAGGEVGPEVRAPALRAPQGGASDEIPHDDQAREPAALAHIGPGGTRRVMEGVTAAGQRRHRRLQALPLP